MKNLIVLGSGMVVALASGALGCVDPSGSDEDIAASADAIEGLRVPREIPSPSAGPAPTDVFIEDINLGGTGCPSFGDASAVVSADRQSFLVIFNKMFLNYPPSPAFKYLNCVAGVRLRIPPGWQFSVATVNTRGFGFLTAGLQARQRSSYFFAGNPIATAWHSNLNGPYNDFYTFTDQIGFTSWSKCGGTEVFAIDTSIYLNAIANPLGQGYFNTETVDGSFKKTFYWSWQPC